MAQRLSQKKAPAASVAPPLPKTVAIPTSLTEVNQRLKEKPLPSKQVEKIVEEAPLVEENLARENFDMGKVQAVVEDIIYNFKEQKKFMEISILRQPIDVTGERIVFYLNGEIQKDLFLKIRHEITHLIRKGVQNHKAEVSYEIKEDAVSPVKKLYTSTDKLNYLREKSPALKELQKRFGLETDF
ncbi:MAG TPA: hypothetical protein VK014_15370 [Cyclobacteriaceae bacterium]|nr:hypothetical protein [Cyclobacteriaceae bacterium]